MAINGMMGEAVNPLRGQVVGWQACLDLHEQNNPHLPTRLLQEQRWQMKPTSLQTELDTATEVFVHKREL